MEYLINRKYMPIMRKISVVVIFLILATSVLYIFLYLRDVSLERSFEKVEKGMPKEEVACIMSPWQPTVWEHDTSDEVLRYGSTISLSLFVIHFEDEIVVSKEKLQSW
ncbi:hypothetical protein [Puniceicoccus vermicola]|uniref:Uncharacterized protein n=1 Tax=Puniceicoccus vermicola TaxID=388746 RepID=A0A7X1E2S4_9BACT|nr:hypothetical protein [Puniceicoccus vermicola]MBC2600306.1 hypothetical protein [Puniceicoccus vermicola]